MKTTIQRWGNSLAVRIPKALAEQTAFEEGDEVEIRAEDGRIVVERSHPKYYRLNDLLAGVTDTNQHAAIDFGPPLGREAW
jgi:antitoxin MazE